MSIRIAFPFFLHAYHVFHGAPTAYELSLLNTDLDVHIFSSSQETTDTLNELGSLYPGHRCKIHVLPQLLVFRYFNVKNRPFPKTQKMIDKHADLFRDMDAIVDTSDSMLRLKTVHNITTPKYISVFHGAGDRKRVTLERFKKFDYFLLCGPKRYKRLKKNGILEGDNWAYGGYPKFDIISKTHKDSKSLFPENRPVVLYNPHFERRLSSWYRWGKRILDYFQKSSRYNLIFAPHVELKGRKNRFLTLKKYVKIPNIHVDLGSYNSADMTYLRLADIYISDVSSQIVEYLYDPRPCIFLNHQQISWENNPYYIQWNLGPVLENLSQLEDTLGRAFQTHERYLEAQIKYFSDSIQLTDVPSAQRSADAIDKFIRKEIRHK